jgi:hypothetical protein
MATEVLPPQLLAKAESAWQQWCSRNTVHLPADQSSSSSSSNHDKSPGCSSELWNAHHAVEMWVHDFAAAAEGGTNLLLQPVLLSDSAGESGASTPFLEEEEQQQVQAAGKQLLGAWVLQSDAACQIDRQPQQQQQQQQHSGASHSDRQAGSNHSWPASWPQMLQQPLSLLQCQHQSDAENVHADSEGAAEGAPAQQQQQQQQAAVVLLCRQEWYSSNEPQQPLGAAMLQLQVIKSLLLRQEQQQQQQAEQEVHQAVESPSSATWSAAHVPMTWAESLR